MRRGRTAIPCIALVCWTLGVTNEASAATTKLLWERPTVYADGTPLPASVPLEYRVWWGRQKRGRATDPEEWRYPKVRVTRSTRFTVTSLPKGQTCFAVTTRHRQTGEESEYSNEVCKKF